MRLIDTISRSVPFIIVNAAASSGDAANLVWPGLGSSCPSRLETAPQSVDTNAWVWPHSLRIIWLRIRSFAHAGVPLMASAQYVSINVFPSET